MMRIKLYKGAIKKLNNAAIEALEKTGEQLHTEIVQAQVMPFKTGNLQNESFRVDYSDSKKGVVHLTVSTPYARRLYFHPEYNFNREENPYAQGQWFREWLNGGKHSKDAGKFFIKFYKAYSGGLIK